MHSLSTAEIQARLRSLPAWHYEFELGGIRTEIRDRAWVNRHSQRRRYFFDPMAAAGLLAGSRVLDLGCNAGFWALASIDAGCRYVRGVDARAEHIAQAELVFEAHGISRDRYEFVAADVYEERATTGNFDVVLCLGLLYHVSKPVELFERMAAVNPSLILIDTAITRDREAVLRLRHDPRDDPRMSADHGLVFVPSASAVAEIAETFGYRCSALRPDFDDWRACEDFRDGHRLAFACTREVDPAALFTGTFDPRAPSRSA